MKSNKIILGIAICSLSILACNDLNKVVGTANSVLGPTEQGLTNDEVIAGLREALSVGANNSTAMASKEDGFLKNEAIKLLFPPDAIKVRDKAIQLGLTNQVERFEMTLNRAAEVATKEAGPIFLNAIKNMSVSDGFTILKGDKNAATNYLREKCTAELRTKFRPKVEQATKTVELTKYWEPLTKAYNTSTILTGKEDVNTDLDGYVTDNAIKGVFHLVEQEEAKIRENPAARVTDILKKVFGSLDK
ncbi:MAG: DUF4197 domain-containing protein [Flavobacteriales bacterium]